MPRRVRGPLAYDAENCPCGRCEHDFASKARTRPARDLLRVHPSRFAMGTEAYSGCQRFKAERWRGRG